MPSGLSRDPADPSGLGPLKRAQLNPSRRYDVDPLNEPGSAGRRRLNGEGSLYRRRDGRWGATLTASDGRRKTVYGRTRAEAGRRLTELIKRQHAGLLIVEADTRTSDYLQRWLADTAQPSVRPSTYASYQLHVRRLLPLIGAIKLGKLGPAQVQAAYAELHRQGLSPQTIQHTHTVLHRALKQAVIWGLIARNPTDGATRPRIERREMKILTELQVRQFLAATRSDEMHTLWTLLVTTGIRLGEALGLKWEDVDLEAGRIVIRRALQQQTGRGLVFVEPKSHRSRRTVVLAPGTAAELSEHRRDQLEYLLMLGPHWQGQDLVFCNDVGRPLQSGQVSWRFHKALDDAGLPRLRLHDLRHTAASLLLAKGVHPKIVQEMLGHATITLTLDTYSHLTPGLQAEAAARMQELFGS